MAYEYRLSDKSISDVDEILRYFTIDLSNMNAAADFLNSFQSVIDSLTMFPQIGTIFDNEFLKAEEVRFVKLEQYILYYLPDCGNQIINILRVIHGSRNINELIMELNF